MSTYHSVWNWNGFFAALDTLSCFKYTVSWRDWIFWFEKYTKHSNFIGLKSNKVLIYLLIGVPITSFAIIAGKEKVCAVKWEGS